MPRASLLLGLFLVVSCADLTQVPPPPVRLSLLDHRLAGVDDDGLPTLAAADTLRLLRAAPSGALVTFHVPDVASAGRRIQKTALYRILTSREIRQLFSSLTASLPLRFPASGPVSGAAGGDTEPLDLLSSLRGEVVVSIEDLPIGEAGAPGMPRLLFMANILGAEQAAESLIEGIGVMAATDRAVKVERGSAGGSRFVRVVLRKPMDAVLEMAVHRGAILLGLGREIVTEAMERAERDGSSAAIDAGFQRCLEVCGDPRDAFRLHLDVTAWLRRFGSRIPEETRRVLTELGLDRVRGLAFSLRPEGDNFVVSTFLDSPGGEDSLTHLLKRHAVDRQFLDLLPSDTIAFSVFALDGRAILRTLRTALPDAGAAGLEGWIGELGRMGIDLEGDLLEVFGPRCSLVTLPVERSGADGLDALWKRFQGLVLVTEVQDAARAHKVLGRLPQGTGTVRRATRTVGSHTVHDYRFVAGQLPPGFSLSYALTDAHLFVALSEDAMTRMLSVEPGRFGTRFREAVKAAPETVASLSYEDVRSGVETLVGLWSSPTTSAPATPEKETSDAGSLASLLRGLEPTVSYTVADDSGLLSVTRSPTAGFGGMNSPLSLLVVASIAIPNMTQARIQTNESTALVTLRSIEAGQSAFRARRLLDSDNDGEGEFGTLEELAGDTPLRSGRAVPRDLTPLPGLVRNASGVYERNGYLFRVFLPAEDGSPVGVVGSQRRAPVDGDLAEAICITVAWPVERDRTGRNCFLLDASGVIYACTDGVYEGANPPPPDVLSSQANNIAAAPLPAGQPGRDGCSWTRVR
ncbi:MAG: hypothetical protein ACT4PV_05515 [Planctomycetaceae bacterium]